MNFKNQVDESTFDFGGKKCIALMGKFNENWVSWKHCFTVSIFRKNIGAPHPTVLGMSPSSSLLGCSRHTSWFCRWSDVQDWYELDPRWHLERRYARANTLLPFTIRQWTIKRRLFRRLRPVGVGGCRGCHGPPDFDRDQLTPSQLGRQIYPPHYYCPLPSRLSDFPTALRL